MPVASFPGEHGWGYDGVAPYAVHEPYGGPAALQRFVDAAHARGLGGLPRRGLQPPRPGRELPRRVRARTSPTRTPPRGAQALNLDGAGSDEVRRWVLDNALQWLRDFHVDGLRLDAVHELHDDRALHVLEELSARGRRARREHSAGRCG